MLTHKCALWASSRRCFSSASVISALSVAVFYHDTGVLSFPVGLCYSTRTEFGQVGIVSSARDLHYFHGKDNHACIL
ncbi:hypothetical protein BDV23DRAFT_166468, partial [Aspergillus alliaceus]